MDFRNLERRDASAAKEFFRSVFTDSAGEQEGLLIGGLARELAECIGSPDVCGFAATDCERMIGAIFFSRLTFRPPRHAFLLAPVAVRSDRQRTGVGQSLINHGLRELAGRGVTFVATYGDPAFYRKVGFRPISKDVVRPPYELSQPEGWLGQSLNAEPLDSVSGDCSCVRAFERPVYW